MSTMDEDRLLEVLMNFTCSAGAMGDPMAGAAGACPLMSPGIDGDVKSSPSDIVVLLGSAVLDSFRHAAELWHRSASPAPLIVVGGVGHSTGFLAEQLRSHTVYGADDELRRLLESPSLTPESVLIRCVLQRHHGVPPNMIRVEDKSSNCGANAELAAPILFAVLAETKLDDCVVERRRVLLVQDPTMQRRTLLCFTKHARQHWEQQFTGGAVNVPLPVFVAAGLPYDVRAPPYDRARVMSLLIGDVARLSDGSTGYGPAPGRGFNDASGPTPREVDAATEALLNLFPPQSIALSRVP